MELTFKSILPYLFLICYSASICIADEKEIDPEKVFKGKVLYERNCQICHQPSGQGIRLAFPSLVGTPWVTGSKDRLIKILLYGVSGPMIVKGEEFATEMAKPGFPPGSLKDAEIAYLLTYIRNAWGNKASEIKVAHVIDIREQVGDRRNPLDSDKLLSQHPLEVD